MAKASPAAGVMLKLWAVEFRDSGFRAQVSKVQGLGIQGLGFSLDDFWLPVGSGYRYAIAKQSRGLKVPCSV